MVHLIESKGRRMSLIAKNPGVAFSGGKPFSGRVHSGLALHGRARWDINARLVAKLRRKQKGNGNYFGRVTLGQSFARIRWEKIGNE